MNYALLIAGGSGNRMGQEIPKQFIHVDDCPIIVHTMKAFERHPDIEAIAVVCLEGWETVLRSYSNQFSITKLRWIFKGGETGMESIHNGIYGLKAEGCNDDDLILVHDGVRPLVSQDIISSNIATCKRFGNAITGIQCREAILVSDDGFNAEKKYSARQTHSHPNATYLPIGRASCRTRGRQAARHHQFGGHMHADGRVGWAQDVYRSGIGAQH